MDLDGYRSLAARLLAGEEHYPAVVERVLRAECSVWIATANLKDLMVRGAGGRYRSVLEHFDEMAGRGVDLRILHASLPSRAFRASFDARPHLVQGGLELRVCPRVHMKMVVVDGEFLYLGSANWTGAGLGIKGPTRRNFELGLSTSDPQLLDQVQQLYQQIWQGTRCRDCGRRDGCEAPLDR